MYPYADTRPQWVTWVCTENVSFLVVIIVCNVRVNSKGITISLLCYSVHFKVVFCSADISRDIILRGIHISRIGVAMTTGGERTRVSADTLVKMAEDSFIASVSYRQIYRHSAFIGTHTSWGYFRWYEPHWRGVSSRDRQSFSRDSNSKSCVVMRVMRISLFPVSKVTVFRVEGDAAVDEGDACLIGRTVIDTSRFHFCYSCLFGPLVNITRFKTQ